MSKKNKIRMAAIAYVVSVVLMALKLIFELYRKFGAWPDQSLGTFLFSEFTEFVAVVCSCALAQGFFVVGKYYKNSLLELYSILFLIASLCLYFIPFSFFEKNIILIYVSASFSFLMGILQGISFVQLKEKLGRLAMIAGVLNLGSIGLSFVSVFVLHFTKSAFPLMAAIIFFGTAAVFFVITTVIVEIILLFRAANLIEKESQKSRHAIQNQN